MESVKHLAKVTNCGLNVTDRGILTLNLTVHYEYGLHQNITGGLCLDNYNHEKKVREGTAYGCEVIRQLLLFFGVDDFSEIAGQVVYVTADEHQGFLDMKPNGIEHLEILKNNRPERFSWKDIYKEYEEG